MASVGQLAAGVAHEINNPTGFVSSNLKTLGDYFDDLVHLLEQYKKLAEQMKENTGSHSESVKEMLNGIEEYESRIDLDYILNDTGDLIQDCRDGTERIKKIVNDLKDFATLMKMKSSLRYQSGPGIHLERGMERNKVQGQGV